MKQQKFSIEEVAISRLQFKIWHLETQCKRLREELAKDNPEPRLPPFKGQDCRRELSVELAANEFMAAALREYLAKSSNAE